MRNTHKMKRTRLFVKLSLAVVFAIQVGADCPSGWIRYEDSCYHFSHDTEPWMLAQMFCQTHGAHLADINSAKEDTFLQSNVQRLKVNHWVGGNDLMNENDWEWVNSNAPFDYTNWLKGEPNNLRTNENCMDLRVIPGWNDEECDHSQNYICEKPSEEVAIVG